MSETISKTEPAVMPSSMAATQRAAEVGAPIAHKPAKSLDIGCGRNKVAGCLGIDRVALPGVDVVHDLDQFPWPFRDHEFTTIHANHFLEHSDRILDTLAEIHRICAPDAQLFIRVPHFASDNFHTDVTHRRAFGYRSFDHFSINGKIDYDFYMPFKFEIVHTRIKFMSPLRRLDPFVLVGFEALVNSMPRLYERFFVYWLPPVEVQFQLRVVK